MNVGREGGPSPFELPIIGEEPFWLTEEHVSAALETALALREATEITGADTSSGEFDTEYFDTHSTEEILDRSRSLYERIKELGLKGRDGWDITVRLVREFPDIEQLSIVVGQTGWGWGLKVRVRVVNVLERGGFEVLEDFT